jgi:hypothetical protein
MDLLQRCGRDGCLEWVEHNGPELPVVFCSPAHCHAWELHAKPTARQLSEEVRCQWCWTKLCGAHELGCPVRVEAP